MESTDLSERHVHCVICASTFESIAPSPPTSSRGITNTNKQSPFMDLPLDTRLKVHISINKYRDPEEGGIMLHVTQIGSES